MKPFKLVADYEPGGDQPHAIDALVEGLEQGKDHQTLLGVTGSGKTFTVANVIAQANRPTLALAPEHACRCRFYSVTNKNASGWAVPESLICRANWEM